MGLKSAARYRNDTVDVYHSANQAPGKQRRQKEGREGGYAHITSNAERANTDNQKYIWRSGGDLSLDGCCGGRAGARPPGLARPYVSPGTCGPAARADAPLHRQSLSVSAPAFQLQSSPESFFASAVISAPFPFPPSSLSLNVTRTTRGLHDARGTHAARRDDRAPTWSGSVHSQTLMSASVALTWSRLAWLFVAAYSTYERESARIRGESAGGC